jgi:hypothetical protein
MSTDMSTARMYTLQSQQGISSSAPIDMENLLTGTQNIYAGTFTFLSEAS